MRRVKDSDLMALMHFEGGECALTGACENLELHHILARGDPQASGDDYRANLIFLERAVHWKITTNDIETRRALGEYVVRERPDFVDYLRGKLGPEQAEDWLRRRLLVDSPMQVR